MKINYTRLHKNKIEFSLFGHLKRKEEKKLHHLFYTHKLPHYELNFTFYKQWIRYKTKSMRILYDAHE